MIKDTAQQDVVIEQSHRSTYIKWAVAVAVVATLGVLATQLSSSERSIKRTNLVVETVELGSFERDVYATGKVVAARAPSLFSTEQGIVTMLKQTGEQVSVGETVAHIYSPALESELDKQRAVLQSAKSNMASLELENRRILLSAEKLVDLAKVDLTAAKRELKRADQLLVTNIISRLDHDKHTDDLAKRQLQYKHAVKEYELTKDTQAFMSSTAKSDLQRQQIAIEEIERRMTTLEIISPVDGAVGSWLVDNKAQVNMGTPIISVVDLTAYEAELRVPDVYGDELQVGMQAELSIGGEKVAATLVSISPEIQGNQIVTRAVVSNEAKVNLRQNQRINARIFIEKLDDVLMVRKGAFLDNGGTYAYRIDGQRAIKTPISVASSGTTNIQIVGGLSAGDEIIISSYDKMKDAEVVRLN